MFFKLLAESDGICPYVHLLGSIYLDYNWLQLSLDFLMFGDKGTVLTHNQTRVIIEYKQLSDAFIRNSNNDKILLTSNLLYLGIINHK